MLRARAAGAARPLINFQENSEIFPRASIDAARWIHPVNSGGASPCNVW
jgi:hypothetical protein